MPATFQGLRNIGERKTKANAGTGGETRGAVMTWLCNVQSTDPGQQVQNIGLIGGGSGLAQFLGWSFLIDPTANQGSFTFGTPKAIQVAIQRPVSWIDQSDDANFYLTGRIAVLIVASGQLFVFAPKKVLGPAGTVLDAQQVYELENMISNVFSGVPGTVQVFFEVDQDSSAGGTFVPPYSSAVRVSLFNYTVEPVSAA